MGYTDRQMRAFAQIAYMDLEEAYTNCCIEGKTNKVALLDLLEPSQVTTLKAMGVTDAELSQWEIADVHNTNPDNGFYACIIETGDGEAAVGYRGSEDMGVVDNVVNDWVNADLGLLNSTMTNQQEEVERFLDAKKEQLNKYDKLAMTGHSLGGNLAEYATIRSGEYGLSDNITQCLSLDGPGFSSEFINKYRREIEQMAPVMKHPRWSFVGTMLNDLPGVEYYYASVSNEANVLDEMLNKKKEDYTDFSRHSLKYLDFYGDSIQRGSQDVLSKVTSVLSEGADHLPAPIGNAMVTLIGSVWIGLTWTKEKMFDKKGNITIAGYEIIAGVVGLISVVGVGPFIAVAAKLVGVVLTFVAVAIAFEVALDAVLAVAEMVYDQLKKLYNWAVEQINVLRDKVTSFLSNVSSWFNKTFNEGYRYASANTYIQMNTASLRGYADRLGQVNRRISNLDRRMDSLYWQVGLQGLFDLLRADALTGYSWRLSRCVNYLNDTAAEFEAVERSIASQF